MSLKHNDMPSDELLVAFLDGELPEAESAEIEAAVTSNETVAARVEFLLRSDLPFYDAFAPLLENAPMAKLESILERIPSPVAVEPVAKGWNRRSFLAAAVGFVFLGVAVDRGFLALRHTSEQGGGDGEWRAAVADYVALYTPETLANLPDDAQSQDEQLRSVGEKLALALPVQAVTLPGMTLKRAQVLQYDGKPLGQLAYLDPEHGPLALCIVQSSKESPSLKTERRHGMNVVFWAGHGHGFMLIGRNPVDELKSLGQKVQASLTV